MYEAIVIYSGLAAANYKPASDNRGISCDLYGLLLTLD